MITGSVMIGSWESGLIVWTLVPGMLKLMVSVPDVVFAQLIASRSELTLSVASTVSAVVVTTRLQPAGVTSALALNSDVLPPAGAAGPAIDSGSPPADSEVS